MKPLKSRRDFLKLAAGSTGIAAGISIASACRRQSASADSRWFDISVTQNSALGFLRRFAGHVETGKPGISDPAVFKEA